MDESSAIGMLGALAQPTRLKVIGVLRRALPEGLPVGEIASHVDTPQNTMSSHLAILTRAGLLQAERDGRIIRYRLLPDGLSDLVAYLENELGGSGAVRKRG